MNQPHFRTQPSAFYTPLDLEMSLVPYVQEWTQYMLFKSPIDKGEVPVPIHISRGFLPSFQAGPQMNNQNKVPAIAIRASRGRWTRKSGEVTVEFFVLTWDDDLDRVAYRDTWNIMTAISNGLYKASVIANCFILLDEPIHAMLVDDPSKDYFFYSLGGLSAQFGVMTPDADEYYPGAISDLVVESQPEQPALD